ncbi:hypothetical protein RHS04_02905 [Rhizoctonia solani]|uniref:DUF6699 domain-containing protein n=1 Tax=Rhizoctonia solani TaxID=456999 RepID=A0A8H7HAY4_9AGAM|nr:hypothetical protein RHS04_02905 [Rhizoctonia solani]
MGDVIGRWAAGPHYGPVLSSTDLYLLGAPLQLHPILTHSLSSFHLVFNLSTGQTGGFNESKRDEDLEFTQKHEPATIPRVSQLIIITKHSPWVTMVNNEQSGVTLGDICAALWTQYSELYITDAEFATLPPRWQEQDWCAFISLRMVVSSELTLSPYLSGLPTDWLRDKVFFDGLELDDDYSATRLGFKAPNVFTMSLCS